MAGPVSSLLVGVAAAEERDLGVDDGEARDFARSDGGRSVGTQQKL